MTALLVVVVVAAVVFAWTNGAHDAANAVATSLSTGALTPRFGLAMAAVLNGLGALIGVDVARTISSLVAVPPGRDGLVLVLAALLAAIGWNALTWWLGLPSSSSHALIAGLVGAGLVAGAHVDGAAVTTEVVVPTVLSPVAGLVVAWLLVAGLRAGLRGASRRPTLRRLRAAQSVSAAAVALAHGLQDGQKTMAALVLALVAAGRLGADAAVPAWVRAAAAVSLALGTAAGGWRLIRTLGRRVAPLDAVGGFAAQTSTALVLYLAGAAGAPVSSTHTVTASVAGAGTAVGLRVVHWGTLRRILFAWLLTPLCCGAAAAAIQALAT